MTSVFGGAQTVPQSTNQAFSQQQQQATQTDTTQNQTANQNVRSTSESNTLSQNLAGDIFNAAHNIYQGGQVPGLNVAPLTPEQYAAIGGLTSGGMGIGSSLIPTGTNFLTSGAGMMGGAGAPLTAEDVAAFYNPMASNVSANLQDIFGQQNLANRLGATTAAGGVGGDRAAVAQGILAQKQGLAAGQVYTDLYQKALQAAQQQKVQQLGAGAGVAGLGLPTIGAGIGGYQTALQGASVPQAQQQAVNTALYQQMMGQYQDPFMRLQAIAAPLPAFVGMGGTTTTTGQTTQQGVGQTIGAANQQSTGLNVGQGQITYPAPSMFSQLAGLGVAGLGAASLFRKHGGRVNPRRFQSGGGIDIGGSIAGPSSVAAPSVASVGPGVAAGDSITIDDSQVPLYRWIDLGTPRTFQYGGEVGDDSGDGGDDSSYVGGSDDYYGEDEGQESKDKLYQELTQRQEQAQTAKKPWQRAQKTLSAINTMQRGLKGFEANTNLKGPTFPPVPWQSMSPIRAGNFQGGGVVAPRGLPMPRANAPSLGNYPQVLNYPALFAAARNAMRPMPRGYPVIRAPIAQPVPVASAPVATAPIAPTPIAPTAPAVPAPAPAATPAVTSMYSPVLKQSPIPNGTYVPSPPLSSEFLQQASTPATDVPEQRETMASPVLQQSPIPSQEGGRVTPSTAAEWGPGETERQNYQQRIARAAGTGPERWNRAAGRYISAAPGRYPVGPSPAAIAQANRSSGVVDRWEPAPGVYQEGGAVEESVPTPQPRPAEAPQESEAPEPTPATSEEELRAQPAGPTPPPPASTPDVAGMPRVGGGIGGMFSGLFGGKGGGTGEERPSPALALMQAGLGMLAASGQRDARGLPMSPLGAIGLGGMAGIQTYQGQQQQMLKDRQRAIQEKNIQDLMRHRLELERLSQARINATQGKPITLQTPLGPRSVIPQPDGTYVDALKGTPIGVPPPQKPAGSPEVVGDSGPIAPPETDEQKAVVAGLVGRQENEPLFKTPQRNNPEFTDMLEAMQTSPQQFDFLAARLALGDTSVLQGTRGRQGAAIFANALKARAQDYWIDKGLGPKEANMALVELGAQKAGARAIENQTGRITGALGRASETAKVVVDLSDKIDRTQYPDINKIILAAKRRTGNEDVVRYGLAMETFIKNYASATGQGSTVLTDHQYSTMEKRLNEAWSKGQVRSVIDQGIIEINRELKGSHKALGIYLGREAEPSGLEETATSASPAARTTPALSDVDKRALDWANANPTDPRAAKIKQRLGVQ